MLKKKWTGIITGICLVMFLVTGCADSKTKDTGTATNCISESVESTFQKLQIIKTIETNSVTSIEYNGEIYQVITVEGGDQSGSRQPSVAVNIGYGEREYWAFTNKYGQLTSVIAKKVLLQDDLTEEVNAEGRYYEEEANVSGTERSDLDQGHVIADSLGGVANAYNITPQDSIINRHGDQAYMEKVIRDAGGCDDFVATITYPNTTTQIPSHYKYEYLLKGNRVVTEFDNINPENEISSSISNKSNTSNDTKTNESASKQQEFAAIDTDGNGKVTIAEAKAAGYSMPIYSNDWLYKYMTDGDGDGMVGE